MQGYFIWPAMHDPIQGLSKKYAPTTMRAYMEKSAPLVLVVLQSPRASSYLARRKRQACRCSQQQHGLASQLQQLHVSLLARAPAGLVRAAAEGGWLAAEGANFAQSFHPDPEKYEQAQAYAYGAPQQTAVEA